MKKLFNAISDNLAGDLDRVNDNGLTRLQQAIIDDDAKRVATLIRLKADLNEPGLSGEPPLHRALATGRSSIATRLIEAGADVNLPDTRGQTPLHKAALQGNTALVTRLINHGADPNIADRDGRTPMHLAPPGCDDCITIMASNGGDVNRADHQGRRPLHYYLKQERMVEVLLALGADPNLGGDFPSPFAAAISVPLVTTHSGVILRLLHGGADINTPAVNGERLMHVAARLGHPGLFAYALARADITLRDKEGNTVLHALMELPQAEHIQAVLAREPAMLRIRNDRAQTPMQMLVENLATAPTSGADTYITTLIAIARSCIHAGGDLSAAGPRGVTLLHEAVARNQTVLIDLLAAAGANLDLVDGRAVAPLQLAIDMRRLDLVDRLLDLGADPDLVDARGWTLLDRLAEKKDRESPIVQRLIVAGGQYNKQLPLYPDLIRPRKAAEPPPPANQDIAPRRLDKTLDEGTVIKKPRPPARG